MFESRLRHPNSKTFAVFGQPPSVKTDVLQLGAVSRSVRNQDCMCGIEQWMREIVSVPYPTGLELLFGCRSAVVPIKVNYCFALHPPERADKHLATLFWEQITRIRPESYMADHDYLAFVSGNKPLFASVLDAVKAFT